jgi:hypothetical protein
MSDAFCQFVEPNTCFVLKWILMFIVMFVGRSSARMSRPCGVTFRCNRLLTDGTCTSQWVCKVCDLILLLPYITSD